MTTSLEHTEELDVLAPDRQGDEVKKLFNQADGNSDSITRSEVIFSDLADSREFASRVAEKHRSLVAELAAV